MNSEITETTADGITRESVNGVVVNEHREVWSADEIPFDVALKRVNRDIEKAQRAVLEKGHSRCHVMWTSMLSDGGLQKNWTLFSDEADTTANTLAEAVEKMPIVQTEDQKRALKVKELESRISAIKAGAPL